MYATEALERACADAWPPLVEDKIGDWRLRAAGGYTGRANSVLAVGEPGISVADALAQAVTFARAHAIPPMAQAVVGSRAEEQLAVHGWQPHIGYARGQLVTVLTVPLREEAANPSVLIMDQPTPAWWELAAGAPNPDPARRHVLSTGRIGYGLAVVGTSQAAATVRAAIVGDLLHIGALAVRPEHRRKGLAGELMAAAQAWGLERGATTAALQVEVGNRAALALYDRLGYSEHHRYRYWVPDRTCEDHAL